MMSSTFAPIFLAISAFSGRGRCRKDQMSSPSSMERAGLMLSFWRDCEVWQAFGLRPGNGEGEEEGEENEL